MFEGRSAHHRKKGEKGAFGTIKEGGARGGTGVVTSGKQRGGNKDGLSTGKLNGWPLREGEGVDST